MHYTTKLFLLIITESKVVIQFPYKFNGTNCPEIFNSLVLNL